MEKKYEQSENSRNTRNNVNDNIQSSNTPSTKKVPHASFHEDEKKEQSANTPTIKKVPHASFHEDEKNEQLDVSDYLIPCSICGRKFMENRLVRFWFWF